MNIGILSRLVREKEPTGISKVAIAICNEIIKMSSNCDLKLIGKDIFQRLDKNISEIPYNLTTFGTMNMNFMLSEYHLNVIHSYCDAFDYNNDLFMCGRVLTVHDLIPVIHPEWETAHAVDYFNNAVFRCARKADVIIANSENTKTDIVNYWKINPDKIRVVYLGIFKENIYNISLDEYKIKKLVNCKFILSVSGLNKNKNQDGLLKAFFEFKYKHRESDIKLVITGPIRDVNIGLSLKDKGLSEDIIYTGYVSDEELVWLYKNAYAFIYPSFYEGFGLPILEAMRVGCPVMCSETTSMPEVGGEAAEYFNPYDVDSIVDTIERVILNENKMNEMKKQSIVQAEKFSYKKAALQTLEVYQGFE